MHYIQIKIYIRIWIFWYTILEFGFQSLDTHHPIQIYLYFLCVCDNKEVDFDFNLRTNFWNRLWVLLGCVLRIKGVKPYFNIRITPHGVLWIPWTLLWIVIEHLGALFLFSNTTISLDYYELLVTTVIENLNGILIMNFLFVNMKVIVQYVYMHKVIHNMFFICTSFFSHTTNHA